MQDLPNSTEQLRELLDRRDGQVLDDFFERQHPHAIAELLTDLDNHTLWLVLERIPRPRRAEVFSHLDPERQVRLIEQHDHHATVKVLEDMADDDRVDVIQGLEPESRQQVLDRLPTPIRQEIETLSIYDEGTAGAVMSTDVVTLGPDQSVQQALDQLRQKAAERASIYYNYVVDAHGKLLGILSLRDLVLADPATPVRDIMNPHVVVAHVDDDQADVARMIQEYDLLALPIVHGDHRLAGVVTVDDAVDVDQEEVTEDFHRLASVGAITTNIRNASVWLLYRRRIPWLLGLVFFNVFSGAGIAFFEETIAAYVALVFFLPLLIDSGGNAGAQSATLMIRALATGDVMLRDWFNLLGKEVLVALSIGLTMAAGVTLITFFRAPEVGLVVASTMVCTVFVGCLIGMLLPFMLTKFRLDPATASAPLITSMADIAGVMIYFGIASWYLPKLVS